MAMTSPVFIVHRPGAGDGPFEVLAPKHLSSEKAVRRQLHLPGTGALWIATGRDGLRWMARGLVGTPRRRRRTLLLTEAVRDDILTLFTNGFDRVVLLPRARLSGDELAGVFAREDRADFCIGGTIDLDLDVAVLLRGDLDIITAPLSDFPPSGDGTRPDFQAFEVVDFGRTLRFGRYEAAFDAVLYLHDAGYRRRIRDGRAGGNPLGASVRRLRKQRGLRLEALGSLAKTVARIERGEVRRPRRATLQAVAERLGTTVEELAQF
jgi:hypothetical protein